MSKQKEQVSAYMLHSRKGNSFHFRKATTPDSRVGSFTITYVPDGTTVMSGDIGNLMWERHSIKGEDYGFPSEDTSESYFVEKATIADHRQGIHEWDAEQAKEDLEEELKGLIEDLAEGEDPEEDLTIIGIRDVISDADSWEHEQDMLNELSNIDYEFGDTTPGTRLSAKFCRNFEILKSVSHLVLQEVQKWPRVLYAIVTNDHIRPYTYIAPHPTNPHYAIYAGGHGNLPVRVYLGPNEDFVVEPSKAGVGEIYKSETDANRALVHQLTRSLAMTNARLERAKEEQRSNEDAGPEKEPSAEKCSSGI